MCSLAISPTIFLIFGECIPARIFLKKIKLVGNCWTGPPYYGGTMILRGYLTNSGALNTMLPSKMSANEVINTLLLFIRCLQKGL